ncbi:transglutaminase domain-containing protein [Seonamhaeicola maritimus]|uniref:transglutaminase domain-containing protein n=1 Tax=Seonamhaeicola maritimus TaxID=2591822 RepID=UPI002494BCC8|nr:transglutaminase domain-containing protein [Seonamhaeicola maritimus]
MIFKKIKWYLKRHPFLYKTRFRLLSRNSTLEGIEHQHYNIHNAKKEIPNIFYETNQLIFKDSIPESDFDKVQAISLWLHTHIKGGPGLSFPSDRTLRIMLEGQGGVCSDMAQIFNNFCVINDIKVREWGITRAPFDASYGGHSFNEIYCKAFNKWILFDSYWCVYFIDIKGVPLSVNEYYELFKKNREQITKIRFSQVSFLKEASFEKNYCHPKNIPFLICNYSNRRYDFVLKYTKGYLPIFVSHFVVYLFGLGYHYRFPFDNYKKIFY